MLVKKWLPLIWMFVFFITCSTYGATHTPQQDADIILKKFIATEKHKSQMLIKQKKLEEGIELTYWIKNGRLQKLVANSSDEFGSSEDHYYFDDGVLILCRAIRNYYPLDEKGQQSTELKTAKHFLLYRQGELIKPDPNAPNHQSYVDMGLEKQQALIAYFVQAVA